MDYGYAQNYGNFYYNPDGLISGSLPALNIDTNTLSDGFTWSEYLAAKTYTDGLYISGMSYDGHCVYKEQPDPSAAPTALPIPAPTPRPTMAPVNLPPGETAKPSPKPSPMPTEYDTIVAVASAVVMNGLDPDDFNAKTDMKTAFRKTIASIIASDEICPGGAADYETCIGEPVATLVRRRRGLLSVSATVDFDMYATVEGSTGAVTAGDDNLADVTTALTTSVSDGSFESTRPGRRGGEPGRTVKPRAARIRGRVGGIRGSAWQARAPGQAAPQTARAPRAPTCIGRLRHRPDTAAPAARARAPRPEPSAAAGRRRVRGRARGPTRRSSTRRRRGSRCPTTTDRFAAAGSRRRRPRARSATRSGGRRGALDGSARDRGPGRPREVHGRVSPPRRTHRNVHGHRLHARPPPPVARRTRARRRKTSTNFAAERLRALLGHGLRGPGNPSSSGRARGNVIVDARGHA